MAASKKTVAEKEPVDQGVRYLRVSVDYGEARVYTNIDDACDGFELKDFGPSGELTIYKIKFLEELQPVDEWKSVEMNLSILDE